jgi:hypothetical protein
MRIRIFSHANKSFLSSEIENYINSFRKAGSEISAEVSILYSTTPLVECDYNVEYSALVMIKFPSE